MRGVVDMRLRRQVHELPVNNAYDVAVLVAQDVMRPEVVTPQPESLHRAAFSRSPIVVRAQREFNVTYSSHSFKRHACQLSLSWCLWAVALMRALRA